MNEELKARIESLRHYKMTPEEKFEQRVSFVYGQQDHDSPGKTKDEIREMLIDMYGRPPAHHQADDATVEKAIKMCPEDACGAICRRCGGRGWIVDVAAIAAMREDR